MTKPRAADEFDAIRARLQEIQGEKRYSTAPAQSEEPELGHCCLTFKISPSYLGLHNRLSFDGDAMKKFSQQPAYYLVFNDTSEKGEVNLCWQTDRKVLLSPGQSVRIYYDHEEFI